MRLLICANCGVEFAPKSARNVYCSPTCGDKANWKRYLFNHHLSSPVDYVSCKFCKRVFVQHPRTRKKFCSALCRLKYFRTK